MTDQLYYDDPRLSRFQARVLQQRTEGDRWAVVLDKTAFYPEGGGQPADRGTLNGIPVLDVQKVGQEILHFLGKPLAQDEEAGAAQVEGTIDWDRRFEYMQQHTGQHIVSASLIEAAGTPTISAYLGERYTAVEIEADTIRDGEIEAAEALANQRVNRNLPVQILWIHPEEAEQYRLRKPPPDVARLRIVRIEGVDAAACAGIHVASTGEVGLIKYDGLEKIRGRLRLHWLIGQRAYRDTRDKYRLIAALNRELTCGSGDILPSVRELRNKLRERDQRISLLERTLAEQQVEDFLEQAESRGGVRLVLERLTEDHGSGFQTLYQRLLERPKTVACLILQRGETLQWRIGCSDDLELPWKQIVPASLPLIEGKGGGKGKSWQGVGSNPQGTSRFSESVREAVWNHLAGGTDA
jgi:alanyl-tRNA synthetase